jgi:GT2 family glycosyltransferase
MISEYSVVIPTKDRHERARGAAAAVLSQTRPPARVVVVDASEPPLEAGSELERAAAAAGVELAVVRHVPSTSGQRNRGVELVESPVVLLLDDDIDLPPDYAELLLERWEANGLESLAGVVGIELGPPDKGLSALIRRVFMLHLVDARSDRTAVRKSGKLRFGLPSGDVIIPAVAVAAASFRTDLLRRHRFDDRFPGYVLGEDLDLTRRISAEAPILQTPAAEYAHMESVHSDPSTSRGWYYRGRRETYYRLRHLDRGALAVFAFALSVVGETAAAAAQSVRERDPGSLKAFLGGLGETLAELRAERRDGVAP